MKKQLPEHKDYQETRSRLNRAFGELRRINIIARMNLGSDTSAGDRLIDNYYLNLCPDDRKKIKGYVFYARSFGRTFRSSNEVYLQYYAYGDGNIDERIVAFGEQVIKILKKHKLKIKWGRRLSSCIIVCGIV